jgi:hypothetical protein
LFGHVWAVGGVVNPEGRRECHVQRSALTLKGLIYAPTGAMLAAGTTCRKGETERAGAHLFKPLRQLVESVNQTFKGQLDLERHGGRTGVGVAVRVLQRVLALTVAIWAQRQDRAGDPAVAGRL